MTKLTDFGFPDLSHRRKGEDHPEVTREKEQRLMMGLIEQAKKITATQEGDQVKLLIITKSGYTATLSKITYPIFKKLYPEVDQALREWGFKPLCEIPQTKLIE